MLALVQQAKLLSVTFLDYRLLPGFLVQATTRHNASWPARFVCWLGPGFRKGFPVQGTAGHCREEPTFSSYLMSFIEQAFICARWGADSVPMAHNPAQS